MGRPCDGLSAVYLSGNCRLGLDYPECLYVNHHVCALCAWLQLEEEMSHLSTKRHGRAKQLVVFFGTAGIGTGGGWGADAVLQACCKVVCRPRGLMWCPVVAPCKPPQAPRSSQEATPAAASEPGPSTPPPAKRNKRIKAEPTAAPTKGKGKAEGKAAKAKPAP
ncbi:hypothetical protein QJQ45_010406 [Haematococcus lacustris]|nr:hypothetical protein QJQ45_010406 [Haematococcus lacustris]